MQSEIEKLMEFGTFPDESDRDIQRLKAIEELLLAIKKPVSDQDAENLVKLFGNDECFGLSWTLLHLIETAPGWPIKSCLSENSQNKWIMLLINRAKKGM